MLNQLNSSFITWNEVLNFISFSLLRSSLIEFTNEDIKKLWKKFSFIRRFLQLLNCEICDWEKNRKQQDENIAKSLKR